MTTSPTHPPPGPPPGQQPHYPPTRAPRNGYGITALILALVGLVFGLVPLTGFLALILGALAVLFGLLGWARARRGEASNLRMTTIGTGLGVLAAALGIWGITITFNAVDQFGRDLQDIGRQSAPVVPDEAPAVYSSSAAPSPLPAPSDFTIDIKVLEKKCFGSAGCHITYQIDPQYLGTTPLTGNTLTVIYEVTGGEDSPQINNFTVRDDGTASFSEQEFVSTPSSGATLTAKVTSISEK